MNNKKNRMMKKAIKIK